MSIFDKLGKTAPSASNTAALSTQPATKTFCFAKLPESLSELQALPEASLDSPYKTAALAVCALCAYAADTQIGIQMLNWLRGPRPLTGVDISFLNDRFRGGKTYLPFSYFAGSVPANNYTPAMPFTVNIQSNANSSTEEEYMKLFISCGGADSPRPITLRRKGDGRWFLWEQYLLTDIRAPKSSDPWA